MADVTNKQLHAYYLKTMGIEVWIRRQQPQLEASTTLSEQSSTVEMTIVSGEEITGAASIPLPAVATATPEQPSVVMIPEPSISPAYEENYLEPMNESLKSENHTRQETLQLIAQEVAACVACDLYKTRTQTVFGVGDSCADWLIVGEAPGADEDAQGEPFVGRAGKLLNSMLYAIGLQRETVYIANVLKCRPPNNRAPSIDEMACCTPFLNRQIALIKPKIILALGATAAQHLLATSTTISELRGKRFEYADTGIPLVATYHPAYLLRRAIEKRKVWQDLQMACRIFEERST